MQDLLTDLELATSSAYKAGEIVKYYMENGYEDLTKTEFSGGNPLTEVDLRVDKFLNETLLEQTPDYGWLSEEKSTKDRNHSDRVWVVDPIDGTSCFIKGLDTFTISIGLLEHGFPVLGVIYNPARDQMFTSLRGHGVFLNGQRMASKVQSLENSLLLMPMDSKKEEISQKIMSKVSQFEEIGSIAYRMALIAAGQADMTFVHHEVHLWDIAAGITMLEEQNFDIRTLDGNHLNYNISDENIGKDTGGFVVCRDFLVENLKKNLQLEG
ncbi:MAG: 3'(2'),5'-bisphosphate nucleotidase CysQ [Proteobacteria bacterium]|nr:3'(2'),5'-bisphosphate nucleotidase CysQ [Pseudomonadota bacterium]